MFLLGPERAFHRSGPRPCQLLTHIVLLLLLLGRTAPLDKRGLDTVLLQLLIKDITDFTPVVAGSMIAGIAIFLSFFYFEAAEDIAREEVVSIYRCKNRRSFL